MHPFFKFGYGIAQIACPKDVSILMSKIVTSKSIQTYFGNPVKSVSDKVEH